MAKKTDEAKTPKKSTSRKAEVKRPVAAKKSAASSKPSPSSKPSTTRVAEVAQVRRTKKITIAQNENLEKIAVAAAPAHAVAATRSPASEPSRSEHPSAPYPAPNYWQDRYGEDRIVLLIRDPYWCFAYWDLTSERQADVIKRVSDGSARLVLRLYDVTGIDFSGQNAHRFMDIDVTLDASHWYLNVWASDRSYCVDLGLLYPDGRFIMLVRSNIVTTPRDSISSVIDEEWMIVDEDFERLYRTAGADDRGRSSEAITKYMLKRVRADVTSGGLASMGSAGGRPVVGAREDFWLVVNTELIVYGATEPDAKVTIQGKPLRLNADGTFSVRYALPDGIQEIPVKAVSANGNHERQITPVVEKRTR